MILESHKQAISFVNAFRHNLAQITFFGEALREIERVQKYSDEMFFQRQLAECVALRKMARAAHYRLAAYSVGEA